MAYETSPAVSQSLEFTPANVPTVPHTFAIWGLPASTNSEHRALRLNAVNTAAHFLTCANTGRAAFASRTSDGTFASATSTTSYSNVNWNHLLGTAASTTSRTIYLNAGGNATSTATNATTIYDGAVAIGTTTPAGNTIKLAMAAAWSVVLTTAEIESLSKGFSPHRIRPQSLVFYAPLIRDLVELKTGATITNVNNSPVVDHPRVY